MTNYWDAQGAVNQETLGISALEDGQTKMNLGPWMNHPELPTTLDSYTRENTKLYFCLSHRVWGLFVTAT